MRSGRYYVAPQQIQVVPAFLNFPPTPDFSFLQPPPPMLPPGGSFTLQVQFHPTVSPGPRNATLVLQTNDPAQPSATVQLSGMAL